ncbi:MAG TPA: flippase, partial [Lutibacter sp.]|nr:flippase [Lutibacter sp.]
VAIYILPSVVYQKFLLPKMHRWAHHGREKFYATYRHGNLVMLIIGIIAMIIVWISATWAIPFLFGANYTDSVQLLNILALSIPVIFVASSVGATLVTKEHMKNKVKYMGSVAVFNILLNIIIIPIYGAIGAAIATVMSNILLLLLYRRAAQKLVFSLDIKVNLKGNE